MSLGVGNSIRQSKAASGGNQPYEFNRQTASYTLVLSDAFKIVELNNAAANTITIPPNSSVAFEIGDVIYFTQYGAGQTTITPGVGVTIRSGNNETALTYQYSGACAVKVATNEWYLFGDLTVAV